MNEFIQVISEMLAVETDLFDPMAVVGIGLFGLIFIQLIRQLVRLRGKQLDGDNATAFAWLVQFVLSFVMVLATLALMTGEYTSESGQVQFDVMITVFIFKLSVTFALSLIIQQALYKTATWLDVPMFKQPDGDDDV